MTIEGMTGEPGKQIPGTTLFDGEAAQKGYALNAICYSFNQALRPRWCLSRPDCWPSPLRRMA
jgi:hypothetical protein